MRTWLSAWWAGLAAAAWAAVSTSASASTICCDVYGDAGCQVKSSGSCPSAASQSIELSIPVVESAGAVKVLPPITSPPFHGFCRTPSTSVCTPGNSGCDPNAPQVPTQCIAVSAASDAGPLHESDFATVEVGKGLLGGSAYSSHRFESCYTYGDGGQWNTWPNTACKIFGGYCCTSTAELGILSSGNGVAVVYPIADLQPGATTAMGVGGAGAGLVLALGFVGRWIRRRRGDRSRARAGG